MPAREAGLVGRVTATVAAFLLPALLCALPLLRLDSELLRHGLARRALHLLHVELVRIHHHVGRFLGLLVDMA